MHLLHRTLLLVALCLASAPLLRAQTALDPSGHWEGTVEAPGMNVSFQVDVAKNSKGEFVGTITVPAQHITSLPLTKIVVEGTSVTFGARADQWLKGVLSADGGSIAGDFSADALSVPFSLTRAGDPRIEARPRSAPIGKELEGSWHGTLDANGIKRRLVLTLSNEPDGTSIGSVVNLDEGGLELPLAITQTDGTVTLDTRAIVSSFSGRLNAEGTELVGTLHQGALAAPLTFRRASRDAR